MSHVPSRTSTAEPAKNSGLTTRSLFCKTSSLQERWYRLLRYCGPYQVFSGKKPIQRYICLITCLVVRAVHLGPVTDLCTENRLMAFDSFCSRRGNPEVINSDNGTNFQRAVNILHDLAGRVSTRSIDWRFIPPGTPHQGGVWERLIGMSKRILYHLVGSKRLNDECFHILICQVEGILNSCLSAQFHQTAKIWKPSPLVIFNWTCSTTTFNTRNSSSEFETNKTHVEAVSRLFRTVLETACKRKPTNTTNEVELAQDF